MARPPPPAPRLADATGAAQGQEPMSHGETGDLPDVDFPPDEFGSRLGQIRLRARQSRVRRDRVGDRLFARSRQRIPDIAGEQVATPTDRPDQVAVRPKDVAQCGNLGLKGGSLNVAVGPDAAYQRVLADDSPAGRDQCQEDIKGTPADPDPLAVNQKLAAVTPES